jgi:hypothetical protein
MALELGTGCRRRASGNSARGVAAAVKKKQSLNLKEHHSLWRSGGSIWRSGGCSVALGIHEKVGWSPRYYKSRLGQMEGTVLYAWPRSESWLLRFGSGSASSSGGGSSSTARPRYSRSSCTPINYSDDTRSVDYSSTRWSLGWWLFCLSVRVWAWVPVGGWVGSC